MFALRKLYDPQRIFSGLIGYHGKSSGPRKLFSLNWSLRTQLILTPLLEQRNVYSYVLERYIDFPTTAATSNLLIYPPLRQSVLGLIRGSVLSVSNS